MRTLSKPSKTKKIQKEEDKKQIQKKIQSKKITKTTFSIPFQYNISVLCHDDVDEFKSIFLPYLKLLRQKMIKKQNACIHKKFISFKKQQNKLETLRSQEFVLGVKSLIKSLKIQKPEHFSLIIIFYQQNRHEILEELFCRALQRKVTLVITKNSTQIQQQLGVKTLTCIGLKNEEIGHKLGKFATRCSAEIPWLVNRQWIDLKMGQRLQ